MFDAIIFDLDGTLWNAAPTTVLGWNRALEDLGVQERITIEDIQSVTGKPQEQCIEILLPEVKSSHPDIVDILNRYEEDFIKKHRAQLYDGVKESIPKLAQSFPLFIVSNCTEWYLDLFFKFSEFAEHFRDFDCHGKSGIPKSEMLKNMIERNGLEKAVYIGDTTGDESAAKDAGLPYIYAAYGFGDSTEYYAQCSSFEEVIKVLG